MKRNRPPSPLSACLPCCPVLSPGPSCSEHHLPSVLATPTLSSVPDDLQPLCLPFRPAARGSYFPYSLQTPTALAIFCRNLSFPQNNEDFGDMSDLLSSCSCSQLSGNLEAQRRHMTCPGYLGGELGRANWLASSALL